MNGAVTLDIHLGSVVDAALGANSTITVGLNGYPGANALITVTNAGSFTLSFAAASGVTPEVIGDVAVGAGAGVKTTYAIIFITAIRYKLIRVGVVAA